MATRPKPRKGKDTRLAIRLTMEQKRELTRKAVRRGIPVSLWLLSLGLAAPEEP